MLLCTLKIRIRHPGAAKVRFIHLPCPKVPLLANSLQFFMFQSSLLSMFGFLKSFLLLLLLCFVLFLTWSLTSLELVRHTRLASNSYTLCLPRSRTKGMSHHAQPYLFLTEMGCHFIEFSMLVCWFLPKGDVTITYSEPEHFPLSHPTHISVKPVLMALWLWKCCLWLSHSVCYD